MYCNDEEPAGDDEECVFLGELLDFAKESSMYEEQEQYTAYYNQQFTVLEEKPAGSIEDYTVYREKSSGFDEDYTIYEEKPTDNVKEFSEG